MHGNAVRGHFVRSMLLFLMTQNRSYSRVRRARQAMLLEEWASAESLSWGLEPLGRAGCDPGHLLPPVPLPVVYLLVDTHKQGLKQTGAPIDWHLLQWPLCPRNTCLPLSFEMFSIPPCTACTSTFLVSSTSPDPPLVPL